MAMLLASLQDDEAGDKVEDKMTRSNGWPFWVFKIFVHSITGIQ